MKKRVIPIALHSASGTIQDVVFPEQMRCVFDQQIE